MGRRSGAGREVGGTAEVQAAVVGDEAVRLLEQLLQVGGELVEGDAVVDGRSDVCHALEVHARTVAARGESAVVYAGRR